MVKVDATWDRLKAVREAGFRTPPTQPDLDPPHEALQLVEHFRELPRLDEVKSRGSEFLRLAGVARRQASELRLTLKVCVDAPSAEARERAEEAFRQAGESCTACHARFRDNG
jgi:hypothetical protein